MKPLVLLINKLNKLTKHKKQILELKFKNTKKQPLLQQILYLLYHYGYIVSYKFIYSNNNLIVIIHISNQTHFTYKLLSKPTYQFNVKKSQLNQSLNMFQSLVYTDPKGVHLFPFHKNKLHSKAGILLLKII
jgi:ribosomal protein S8